MLIGGEALTNRGLNERTTSELARAELLAFPVLLLLSFWFFRGLGAALAVAVDASIVRALLVPLPDGAHGQVELVGAKATATPARPHRATGVRSSRR